MSRRPIPDSILGLVPTGSRAKHRQGAAAAPPEAERAFTQRLPAADYRWLLERAQARTLAEGRRVGLADVVRDLVRAARAGTAPAARSQAR